jgi:hypothetical protein
MLRLLREILLVLVDCKVGKLLARLLWSGTGFMTERRLDDPIYKKNVRELIERNRRFEENQE